MTTDISRLKSRQMKGDGAARSLGWVMLPVAMLVATLALANDDPVAVGPTNIGPPVTPFVFDGDLRDLPPAREWRPGDPIKMIPRRQYPSPDRTLIPFEPTEPDPLYALQRAVSRSTRAFSPPLVGFQGMGFTGVFPPDTVGDVGPNHYIQSINGSGGAQFRVFDKTGGPLTAVLQMDSLFTANAPCRTGLGDPIVLYDQMADRWLLSEFSDGGNNLCVYISQTADPVTGGWYAYGFRPANSFPDYPKYSVWSDGYYVTTNQAVGAGEPIFALDRSQMLAGNAATTQTFSVGLLQAFGFQALTPADHDGASPPPAGAPAYFARHRDDENSPPATNGTDKLELWSIQIDWVTPANSLLTQLPNVLVAEFDSALCGLFTFSCVPQPNPGIRLDPLREVIMNRLQYRNMGTHEVLVGNLSTDVGDFQDHAGIRWFELRKTGAGPWTLFQQGTYSPNATHHWMAAISMDQAGNIALGYSISSTSQRASMAYTGRLATDPTGVMTQPEFVSATGTGVQNNERWGDYAALSVDPLDNCTFWHTTEYMPGGQWSTWVAAFKFDSCPALSCTATAAATPPAPPQICEGQTTPFDAGSSALANCSGTIAYQWLLDGNPVPGETNRTYTTSPAVPAGVHSVDVSVTCSSQPACTDTLDAPITLRIQAVQAAAALSAPEICFGGTSTANASTSTAALGCSVSLEYQWILDGTPIPGATNVIYTTDPTLAAGSHTLDVTVTCPAAPGCSDRLDVALQLLVHPLPLLACGTPLYSGSVGTCIPFGFDAVSNGTSVMWAPVAGGSITNPTSLNGACFTSATVGLYPVQLTATLGSCSDSCTVEVDVGNAPTCTPLPSAVDMLLAVEWPTPADVQFSWDPAVVGFFRVNSVDLKTALPAYRSTGATERCITPDSSTLNCTHAAATPVGPVDVLYYTVLGVCASDPAIEGP